MKANFPPYELVDQGAVASATDKTRKLERLYHLTQTHGWDGKATLAALVEKHGAPGRGMDRELRASLVHVLSVLLWGELAAWSISADLALEIEDVDAKMAATGQVFDEARHFTVMRDYLFLLAQGEGDPIPMPRLGGMARKLLVDVLEAPTLAKKLLGMQLLFETNAVVIFRRLADSGVCPVLAELLPYFERDESRHVGLGVLYLPRLVEKMSRAEAVSTASFQMRCIAMLIAGGFVLRPHFERLGLDQRLMATRVTVMQDEIVRQMVEAHGRGIARAILNPRASALGPIILDLIHPPEGLGARPRIHRAVHRGVSRAVSALDRALAN
jgi:GNAT superfamily N-acetyltransferase